ncbi:hypothetical protein GGR50DRAFT_696601 [Xylaria sp. CBS 124048]|nr:hypothetical protein GGR50DRAFT_696601 [Xylaria sp. CBS 124048]
MARKNIPRERLQVLQKSYDQLCEWLNYDTSTKHGARRLLDSSYIKPFFREYRRDYLEASSSSSSSSSSTSSSSSSKNRSATTAQYAVQCADLYHWCISTNAFAQPQYANDEISSSKKDWTPLDHATRFLVRVLRFSWQNNGEWSSGKFDPDDDDDGENELEVYQVWAILQYLQAEWEAANVDDWEVERLALGPVPPSQPRPLRPQHPLRQHQIDDVRDQHPGVDKDVGGDGQPDVVRPRRPRDAQPARHRARHREAEERARDEESSVPPALIHLQERHVRRGGDEVDG